LKSPLLTVEISTFLVDTQFKNGYMGGGLSTDFRKITVKFLGDQWAIDDWQKNGAQGKLKMSKGPDMEGLCLRFTSYVPAFFFIGVYFFILVFRRDNGFEFIITCSFFFCRHD